MDKQEIWKYEISTGKTPVVLSSIMLAMFGGLTFWLHETKNGAFFFAGLLTAIFLLVFLLTLYRMCFYRIRIGQTSFSYQTGPGNERIFPYRLLRRAWTSQGRQQNGYNSRFCSIDIGSGQVIRFPFYDAEKKAVAYLLQRIEKLAGQENEIQDPCTDTYVMDGKVYGKGRMIACCVLLPVVIFLDNVALQVSKGAGGLTVFAVLGSVTVIFAMVALAVQYACFRVEIGTAGVFLRTLPWNGQYYAYDHITRCREVEKVVRIRRSRRDAVNRSYYYFFEFTDKNAKTRKFQFEKSLYSHEITVLRQRIEQSMANR